MKLLIEWDITSADTTIHVNTYQEKRTLMHTFLVNLLVYSLLTPLCNGYMAAAWYRIGAPTGAGPSYL